MNAVLSICVSVLAASQAIVVDGSFVLFNKHYVFSSPVTVEADSVALKVCGEIVYERKTQSMLEGDAQASLDAGVGDIYDVHIIANNYCYRRIQSAGNQSGAWEAYRDKFIELLQGVAYLGDLEVDEERQQVHQRFNDGHSFTYCRRDFLLPGVYSAPANIMEHLSESLSGRQGVFAIHSNVVSRLDRAVPAGLEAMVGERECLSLTGELRKEIQMLYGHTRFLKRMMK